MSTFSKEFSECRIPSQCKPDDFWSHSFKEVRVYLTSPVACTHFLNDESCVLPSYLRAVGNLWSIYTTWKKCNLNKSPCPRKFTSALSGPQGLDVTLRVMSGRICKNDITDNIRKSL